MDGLPALAGPSRATSVEPEVMILRLPVHGLQAGRWVSTIWLGQDDKRFESVVFNEAREGLDRESHSTEAAAHQGHERLVKKWSGQAS